VVGSIGYSYHDIFPQNERVNGNLGVKTDFKPYFCQYFDESVTFEKREKVGNQKVTYRHSSSCLEK
jgi:hypothetical protein